MFEERHGRVVEVVQQIFEDQQHSRERKRTSGIQRMTSFRVERLQQARIARNGDDCLEAESDISIIVIIVMTCWQERKTITSFPSSQTPSPYLCQLQKQRFLLHERQGVEQEEKQLRMLHVDVLGFRRRIFPGIQNVPFQRVQ